MNTIQFPLASIPVTPKVKSLRSWTKMAWSTTWRVTSTTTLSGTLNPLGQLPLFPSLPHSFFLIPKIQNKMHCLTPELLELYINKGHLIT